MSLLSSFGKRSTLESAVKQVAKARQSESGQAEQLYKSAYQGFASVIADHPLVADALYQWGFGLLHEAGSLPPEQAGAVYEDAITKFSFCLLMSPNYLGAAIDGGVAFMELARLCADQERDGLYGMAKEFFDKANQIQKGSAAYNLACIYALRNDEEACLEALELAKANGSVPDEAAMLADPDMANVLEKPWFKAFVLSMQQVKAESAKMKKIRQDADFNPYEDAGPKVVKKETFDYYE